MIMKQRGSKVMDMKPLKHYTDAPLCEAFWPFLMAMKYFGLFHNKEYIKENRSYCTKDDYSDRNDIPPLSKRVTPSSIYCLMVTLILWANVGRCFTLFERGEDFGPLLFQKAIMMAFFFLVAVNATSCYIACYKYSNIPEFFYEWAKLHQEYPGKCDLIVCSKCIYTPNFLVFRIPILVFTTNIMCGVAWPAG